MTNEQNSDRSCMLIVNADDFGLTPGVTRGIIKAHQCGIVTSASLMVRAPTAPLAAAYARRHPRLSVGLHLDLGEWIWQDGEWKARYEVVRLDDPGAVAREIDAQVDMFRAHLQRDPSHIDSHQHVHRDGVVRKAVTKLARRLAIPVRHFTPQIHYCGRFYGQPIPGQSSLEAVTVEALVEIFESLPLGITELACHPGSDEGLISDYAVERTWELRTLCDPQLPAELAARRIALCSFASPEVVERFAKV